MDSAPTPLSLRPVAAMDFSRWLPLWEGYNRFYGRPAFPPELYDKIAERSGFVVYRKQL
ncbi:MAG TPA: hypothetical protein VKY89_07370 [Thermoanaerobaculia bacterium]|nr:hypothetical protein [Thermoanaerobaculia bacterium]